MTPLSIVPKIETREQLNALVENILRMQLERDLLESAQENEIASIRQKYRPPLADLERLLSIETAWAEIWARANPQAFTENRLDSAGATLGFRVAPPRIDRASRKWTWARIAQSLAETVWGKRYLRVPPPEVNKDAILADLDKLSPVDLRAAGLKIIHGDRFYLQPQTAEETTAPPETTWEEAA